MTKVVPPLHCRLFGHLWKPAHVLRRIQPYGLLGWVYTDDVCQRCYATEYRLPNPHSQPHYLPDGSADA